VMERGKDSRSLLFRLETDFVSYDERGSLFYLLINLGDVLAKDTQYEEEYAEHEDDEGDDGAVTGEGHAFDKDPYNGENEVSQ